MPTDGMIAKEASEPVSPMQALSRGECQPAAIGTVTSVHTDPKFFGTDIVLDANDGQEWEGREWHGKEHAYVALIPIGSVKIFPALDTYVGQKVIIWTFFNNGGSGVAGLAQGAPRPIPRSAIICSSAS